MTTRTRRTALRLAAIALVTVLAAAVVVVRHRSTTPSATSTVRTFKSRPDLHPPVVTVTKRADGLVAGDVFLTLGGPLIVDDHGDPVWYHPLTGEGSADLNVQEYRGQPVLTWWQGKNLPTFGQGDWVIADTSYNEIARIHAANGYLADLHDLVITARGTALLTTYATKTADLRAVGGPASGPLEDGIVQEVDIATGRVLFEWHASDHVTPDASYAPYTAGTPYDFFHVNSVDVDDDQNLLISSRHTSTVYKVDRSSGAVLWQLGGKHSTFQMGDGTQFAWQHDARRQPDGTLSLFDNSASAPTPGAQSSGLVLRLDEANKTATLVRRYTHPTPLLAMSQGDLQLLENGDALVGWGALPDVSQFTHDGTLVFDAHFAGATQSYRAFRWPWHGHPTDPPSLSTAARKGGLTVYASWNGATDVARWEIVAGSTRAGLRPVATAVRAGFETAVALTSRPTFVAVRALDAAGNELGQSATVHS